MRSIRAAVIRIFNAIQNRVGGAHCPDCGDPFGLSKPADWPCDACAGAPMPAWRQWVWRGAMRLKCRFMFATMDPKWRAVLDEAKRRYPKAADQ